MFRSPRLSLPVLGVSFALVVGLLVGACGGCSSLLYHPTHTPADSPNSPAWTATSITTPDAETIRGVLSPPKNDNAPWLRLSPASPLERS